MRSDRIKMLFRANLALAFVAGLFVLWQYVRTSSETGSAVFLGFSPLRLATLLGVILVLAASGYLFISSWRSLWWERWGKLLDRSIERSELFWLLLFAFGSIYVFLFSSEHYLGRLATYRASLQPILVWLALAAFLGWVSFLWLRAYELPFLERYRGLLLPSAIAFLTLGLILLFVAVTRIGLKPDPVYWQDAGTPILLPQVWVAWLAGILLFYGLSRFPTFSARKIDLLLCLGLWMVACVLWLNQPLTPAYNALEAKAPNFQMYPFGDAIRYDVAAHGFLMGKPIPSDFWVKPLYTLFIAFLHMVAKENFGVLVVLQVLVLALVPVLVYLLTSEMAQRPAGLVAGLLVILRERNSIALSNVIEVSHSRLLISDVFSMGLMALLLLLLIKSIKNPENRSLPFSVGGIVALLTLTRGHPIVLVPVIGFIFLILLYRSPLLWRNLLLLALGAVLPLLPWFWRNYERMGKFAFQNPVSAYSTQMAALYSMTPGLVASPRVADETDSAYYERLQKQVFEFVVDHPDELVRFVSAHYAHNALFSYVYLPHSFEIESLRAYIKTAGFWRYWKGHFTTQGWILLVLNMGVIVLGIGAMWKDVKWLTFVPLLLGMGYNLSVSVGRLSGWRLILPADWITLIYYAAGLMQVAYLIHDWLSGRFHSVTVDDTNLRSAHPQNTYAVSLLGLGALFLAISLFLTYGHKLFLPRNNTIQTQEQLIQEMAGAGEIMVSARDVEKFLTEKDAVIVSGRALYPAFFKANSGVLNHYWLSFDTKPYDRIVFYLMGNQPAGVVLPMESPPSTFPDTADVIVLGCKTKAGNIDALSVVITSTDAPILYRRDTVAPLTCPLPAPK